MRHNSIKLSSPCEFINITPVNPLISKCQIKVCYVGDEPNRNKSIITKDVARDMANSLPGSPIVGFYREDAKDFDEHTRELSVNDNGEYYMKDITRPYGFVDLNAKCWFQKFLDDGQNEHEYLMTEGYLWTGQYPEAQRIIDRGNNQSMELDDKLIDATWAKDSNGKPTFFIINEAIISKLCILGEDCEPCFEGSNITKLEFSLGDDFKQELFSMMKQLKEILNEGGEKPMPENENKAMDSSITEDLNKSASDETEFKKNSDEESKKKDETDPSDKANSDNKSEDDKSEKEASSSEKDAPKDDAKADSKDDAKKEDKADEEDDKKKKKYSLDEIPEYTELTSKYSALENQYNDLVAEAEGLRAQITELEQFKLNAERVQKQDMINNTFYMLSAEDKKDVIDNIDKYSLDEIEAKLSILCVRNKVSFAELEDNNNQKATTYNLDGVDSNDSVPAWIKAVLDTAKEMNE